MRRCVVREGFDRGLAGLERQGELVAPELEAAQPDQARTSSGESSRACAEGRLGRCVQRGVGGLADPLEQGETEVALRGRVVRIGLDPCGQRLDEGLGGRKSMPTTAGAAGVSRGPMGAAVVGGAVIDSDGSVDGAAAPQARHQQGGRQGAGSVGASARACRGYGPRHRPDDNESPRGRAPG